MLDQLCTLDILEIPAQVIDYNEEYKDKSLNQVATHTLKVSNSPNIPPVRSLKRKPNKHRGRKKTGGWVSRTGLEWAEVKDISNQNHEAKRLGIEFNYFLTINYPSKV